MAANDLPCNTVNSSPAAHDNYSKHVEVTVPSLDDWKGGRPPQSSRFHLPEFTTSVLEKPPVWRNGRRTGLKNVKMAISGLFS
jgi:hypothetical protein